MVFPSDATDGIHAAPATATVPTARSSEDIAHAARSGGMQVLTVAAQALLSITHVLLARLFGRAVFGSYQACLAILELVTRGGTGGTGGAMLRYVAAHRARGEEDNVRSAIGTGLWLCLMLSSTAAAILIATAGPVARLMREPALEPALRIMAPAAIVGRMHAWSWSRPAWRRR